LVANWKYTHIITYIERQYFLASIRIMILIRTHFCVPFRNKRWERVIYKKNGNYFLFSCYRRKSANSILYGFGYDCIHPWRDVRIMFYISVCSFIHKQILCQHLRVLKEMGTQIHEGNQGHLSSLCNLCLLDKIMNG
jgi:hypothetical protein